MEHQKMSMGKNKFRIGDLAHELKVKKYVIRFWEKEFDLNSDRSQGGQRFYTQDDLNTFIQIKDLLYNQKFTIAGAKKHLKIGVAVKEVQKDEIKELEAAPALSREHIMPATVEHQITPHIEHFFRELQNFKHELQILKERL